jgi:hypothetical protein
MYNLLGNYLFLTGIHPDARAKIIGLSEADTKDTEFIGGFMPNASSLAKQYAGNNCFYLVEDAYFNVFNRDRIVHDFFFEFFYSVEKAIG